MEPLRVRILGNGKAAELHKAAFDALPSYYQVTESSAYDILDICTPNYLHFEQIKMNINNSHIIVEKPICSSLQECDEIIKLSEQSPFKILPVFQYRFTNHGPLQSRMHTSWLRPDFDPDNWKFTKAKALGGCVFTHKIHMLDLVLQKRGLPSRLTITKTNVRDNGLETSCEVSLLWEYPDRIADIITVSTEIVNKPNAKKTYYLGDSVQGFINMFSLFHSSIVNRTSTPVTLQDARNVLDVTTAIYYATAAKKTVALPIPEQHPFYSGWQSAFSQLSPHFQVFR